MSVVISLLRGINVGGRRMIKMDTLKSIYAGLGMLDVQTYVNSGNILFRTAKRDLSALARTLEDGIEQSVGFRPDVILRRTDDLRQVIAANPFASREGIDPAKLLVVFLASDPPEEAREKIRSMTAQPEELRIEGRELYIYFPEGMGKSKLSLGPLEKSFRMPSTGRNWNTVTKLLEMGEKLEPK